MNTDKNKINERKQVDISFNSFEKKREKRPCDYNNSLIQLMSFSCPLMTVSV